MAQAQKHTPPAILSDGTGYKALDGLQTAIVIFDGGGVCYANAAFERLAGQSLKQLQRDDAPQSEFMCRISEFALQSAHTDKAQDIIGDDKGRKFVLSSGTQGVVEVYVLPQDTHEERSALNLAAQILGHEMRTPLASLRGAAQLLARQVSIDGQSVSKLVEVIDSETQRLSNLSRSVDSLVDMDEIDFQPVDINKSLHQNWAQNDAVTLSLDPSLPHVMADEGLVSIIIDNLIRNALEASDACRVETGFDPIFRKGADKLPVYIRVFNHCADIDALDVESIFEPFVSSKGQGRGIGLAIVKKLVNGLGAHICANKVEDNVTFSVHFRYERTGK